MKKITAIFILMALCLSLFACSGDTNKATSGTGSADKDGSGGSDSEINYVGTYSRDLAGTTINVFNCGEYISDGAEGSVDVNKEFEKLTGIKVNYSTYANNEAMYAKLKSGAVAYDIIVPSDYMIERLISEDMLEKLDFTKLTNYNLIDSKYKGVYYDPNEEYSVPYNVGMVAMIYNKTMVDEAPTSWSVMWDEKYKDDVLSFANPRDAFAIAQLLLGIDLNTTDKAQWDRAYEKLLEQKDILQGRVDDEVFNKMEQGNAAIATYYAGDCVNMKDINDDLEIVYPEEGVNIFIDGVCVPKGGQNYDAAMMYINFLMEPEIALANAEYICYASPNTAVVSNENYSLAGNEILYPSEDKMPKTEYFHDLPEDVRSYYEKLWEKVFTED